jgi:hypothetical protein
VGERELLEEGELDPAWGLVGDTWRERSSRRTPDGSPHPDMQLNVMNARAIKLFAGTEDRWPLAGDQLYVDFDLSEGNLPAGTHLRIGNATLEVSVEAHPGCQKFAQRFGLEATRLLASPKGKRFRLRGINARVIDPGTVSVGDVVEKMLVANVSR